MSIKTPFIECLYPSAPRAERESSYSVKEKKPKIPRFQVVAWSKGKVQ